MTLAIIPIEDEDDVVTARQRIRAIAAAMGFGPVDQTRLATAVSELAHDVCLLARGGRLVVDALEQPAPGLALAFEKDGPCEELDQIEGNDWLCDEVHVRTSPAGGLSVRVIKWLHEEEPS